MMTRPTPWDEIRSPDSEYNVRRIPGSAQVPLYWGKDVEGHCLFIIELEGDHSAQFRKGHPSVHGIRVDLRRLEKGGCQGLVLTLEHYVDRDLFHGLCETLVASLRQVADSAAALGVGLTHIKRWKAFMAGRKAKVLSPEEVRGLFAELQVLRSLYKNGLSEKAAVDAWSGPEGVHQDFIFRNTAVEVKGLSGRERSTVRISSEDQMEALCDNLFLLVVRLSEMPDSDRAFSLNEAVRRVIAELTDGEALEELSVRLASYGYVELREYDEPKLLVTGQRCYRVIDGFPRLIRSEVPDGISRVAYDIELEKVASFECDIERIWES